MALRIVRASSFTTRLDEDEQQSLISAGITPINDAFLPYWQSLFRHEVYYGGRGSGKSKFIAQKLINKCRYDKYFRWQYSRKNQVDIKESSFELLKQTASEMRCFREFKFNESTLKVTHRNGNAFIAKGMDDPERKGKGTVDLNGFWGEEITEFDQNDIVTINQNLRTPKGPIQSIVSFNPVHEEHWVRHYYFSPTNSHAPNTALGNVMALRTTLWDNHFINREQYAADLMAGAVGNANIIRVVLDGDWGLTENDNPWLYNLDLSKHFRPVKFIPSLPVYLSFDFNNDPFACIAFQFSEQMGGGNSFLHVIDEFSGIYKIEEMCQRIKSKYPQTVFFITGDRSGQNEDLGRNQTLYQMICSYLGVPERCLNLNNSNLEHADSRILCNTMLYHYPHFFINKEACPNLYVDMQKATVDITKPKASHLKKDRENYKMDAFDAWRYGLQTYFLTFARNAYFGTLTTNQSYKKVA